MHFGLLLKRAALAFAGCAAIATGAFLLDSAQVLPPAIWWFHPGSGLPGTEVRIVGNGFGEALLVTFGGTRAEFSLAGPLVIKARVPAGAATGPHRRDHPPRHPHLRGGVPGAGGHFVGNGSLTGRI